MLNKNGQRELAYLVIIDDIQPIIGSDNCEQAIVGGWHVMVRKGMFNKGDIAIYFEIDSLVNYNKPEFSFMEKYHGRVKTQKYTFGGKGLMISQGLLMHPNDFDWGVRHSDDGSQCCVLLPDKQIILNINDESRFVTELLDVHYYDPEDEKRKKDPKSSQPKLPKFFYSGIGRKMMRIDWLKKLIIKLFGKSKKKNGWPVWVVKTDEERVQNIPWIIKEEESWVATEKIDGTSTTFTMRRKGRKFEFLICSRNVVFDKPDKKCFYETNVYTEMAEKYPIETFLKDYLNNHKDCEWVTLQGETYGGNIQKRDYSTTEHLFAGFNLIDSVNGRLNSVLASKFADNFEIPWVPILDEYFVMPNTVEELLDVADGYSVIDNLPREGIVFRSHDGKKSFKAVSNAFLLQYHN